MRAVRSPRPAVALALVLASAIAAQAQPTTGAIAGVLRDASGATVAGAAVTVTSEATGAARVVATMADGQYVVPLLPPGLYSIVASGPGGRTGRHVTLTQAGATTRLNLELEVTPVAETVTVRADPRLRADHHQVGSWIDRRSIDDQPLNGRSVLELVKLEPGLTVPERLAGGRVFISSLGAGLQTVPRIGFARVTLDGGNIETPGTVATLLQIPADVVDQLHVATVGFDMSTGLATSGVVNIVTRAGTNDVRGTAFSLYRDRRWSALDDGQASARDPSFRRHQAGGALGGPLRRGRAFFFAAFERHHQRDLILVRPSDPALRAFGGAFTSPSSGHLTSGRVDLRLSERHRAALRHTHDANTAFASSAGAPEYQLPSAWASRPVRAHQSLASITSVLTAALVNDLRASVYATSTAVRPATASDCPDPCFGLGQPRLVLTDGSATSLIVGATPAAAADGYRWHVSDALVVLRGAHLIRLGFDWEHTRSAQLAQADDQVQLTLWTPDAVRARDPSLPLPASFTTIDDLYRLPLRSFATTIAASDAEGLTRYRVYDMLRVHAADQWRVGERFSLNGGLAWAYEPGVLNHDLRKPAWLVPLVGHDGLEVPRAHGSLSGTLGAAWQVTSDGRTVVRGGVGRYSDSIARTVALNLATERELLSRLGTRTVTVSGTNVVWNGRRLSFPQPTTFSGADLLPILPEIRALVAGGLPSGGQSAATNLDLTKEGRNLYDPSYTTPRALHASVGVHREVGRGLVLGIDVAWKRFAHTFINGIDYNRFFSVAGPVIPACTAEQRTELAVVCSNGSLYFDTTSGRARYLGVLVRAEQRFTTGAYAIVSYALGSFVGSNGTGTGTTENPGGRAFGFSNDDWLLNYGPLPTDLRHVLSASGATPLPWNLRLAFSLSATSRPPFAPYVAGMDFDGDGTINDLLPGTRVNQFNRSLDRDDLERLVRNYNDHYAGTLTAGGQLAPPVTLPDAFGFNDTFFTLDVRVSHDVQVATRLRLTGFVDVFNVFDTKNFVGYGSNLASPGTFGQPGSRVGQAFGPGGPRAAQVGVRIGF